MKEKEYENLSEGLNYSYVFFGGGSFIALMGSLIYDIPVLSVFSVAILWGCIYFLPYFNEMRTRAKYGKIVDSDKIQLVIRGMGIYVTGTFAYCFFVLDYKFYYRNQKLILFLNSAIILFMLVNAAMKLSERTKVLEYKSKLEKKTVIYSLLIVIQFILLCYPIYDYIKADNTYSLPSIKVANNVTVKEIDLSKDKKTPIISNVDDLPNYISEAISNKSSKDLAFLQTFRVALEEQREKYYEVVFDYKLNENSKAENEVYASSLQIFKDKPIVIATLKSYDKDTNKLSKLKYRVEIELSEEEYKTTRDYVVNFINK